MVKKPHKSRQSSLKQGFICVRHGETTGNAKGIYYPDPPLTKKGIDQARNAGLLFKQLYGTRKVAGIGYTPTERSLHTAIEFKETAGIEAELYVFPEFKDRDMGIYNGKPIKEFVKNNPHLKNDYLKYGNAVIWLHEGGGNDGVEPLHKMRARIEKGISRVARLFGEELFVMVGHAGQIKMLTYLYASELVGSNLREALITQQVKNGEIYDMDRARLNE